MCLVCLLCWTSPWPCGTQDQTVLSWDVGVRVVIDIFQRRIMRTSRGMSSPCHSQRCPHTPSLELSPPPTPVSPWNPSAPSSLTLLLRLSKENSSLGNRIRAPIGYIVLKGPWGLHTQNPHDVESWVQK